MLRLLFVLGLCITLLTGLIGCGSAANYKQLGRPLHLSGPPPIDLSIQGPPMATERQCVQYLLRRNPLPILTVSPQVLVALYYQEGKLEGIRPDVAFAQALHETGFFRYGGDVVGIQNNFAGLGTTGKTVDDIRERGNGFATAKIGVAAQIQHLLGYSSRRPPKQPIVDPRYELLKSTSYFGQAVTWTDLNGRWAQPGTTYGQTILRIHSEILAEESPPLVVVKQNRRSEVTRESVLQIKQEQVPKPPGRKT